MTVRALAVAARRARYQAQMRATRFLALALPVSLAAYGGREEANEEPAAPAAAIDFIEGRTARAD